MSIWINLGGIRQRIPIISSTLGVNVNTRYLGYSNINSNDYIAGWGLKNNTSRMRKKSAQLAVPYLHLEDGFIGYLGHPADNGHAVSLVADEFGIYYDARMPSGLERCVNELIAHDDDSPLLTRASLLIDSVVEHGVTKYNCYNNKDLPSGLAARLASDQCETVLIIDQVAGDLSIKYSLASEQSFVDMVAQAKADFPNARLLLRTHPDTRVGKKRGVLARLELPELEVISEACHPHALIKQVDAVYTVSSQMGFEALLLGKPVYCFGLPFYAGWGLTHDTHSLDDDNRRGNATLEQLVAAALILYPKYYDPVLQCKCEVEDIVRLVALQYEQAAPYKTVYMLGFSLWKRAFMQRFCKHLATKLHFVQKLPKQLACDEAVLVWGGKYPELNDCIRVEDGFIRSSGLGSNLNRPSSLSIDHHGMFCDSRTPSDLELLLNDIQLTPTQASRAKSLLTILRERRVSKYNVGNRGEFVAPDDGKALILVVGQVDGDASIVNGSPVIKSNEALLWAVRESLPNAHILYKPHPDVVSGNRGGEISARCMAKCVDSQVLDLTLDSLYPHIDALHTMTSQSGFEAIIQGVKVVTWGQPFYASWGLTEDKYPVERRTRSLSLAELVYGALISYPRYVDWNTGLSIGPEQLIEQIAQQSSVSVGRSSFVKRNVIKVRSLFETLAN